MVKLCCYNTAYRYTYDTWSQKGETDNSELCFNIYDQSISFREDFFDLPTFSSRCSPPINGCEDDSPEIVEK